MYENSGITASVNSVKKCLDYRIKESYNIENPEVSDTLLKIHGLHKDNFDFINNIETTINKGIADASYDSNANKNETSAVGVMAESTIPVNKIIGYRELYRQLVKDYGKKEAKRLSALMYDMSLIIADSSKILLPYCFSLNASKLVFEGRDFGMLPSKPPKSVRSYISALSETVHQLSNHVAGALAVGSLFFDVAYVAKYRENISLFKLRHNKKILKEIENDFQSFVHSVNHLSRNAMESPFTNISVFDREKLNKFLDADNVGWMFEKKPFYHSAKSWKKYIIKYIMELQHIYMNFFEKGDPLHDGRPYRFPVTTANIAKVKKDDKWIAMDDKFVNDICKRDIYRYNIMVSEGSKVASCCFSKNQKTLTKSSKGVNYLSFEELQNSNHKETKENFKIFHNGSWVDGKQVKLPSREMYKITTSNKKEIIVTDNHLNPSLRGDIATSNLTTDDYLLFNSRELNTFPEKDLGLTYEQGILIGMYLGDGSIRYPNTCNSAQINFSLNKEKYENSIDMLTQALEQLEINAPINLATEYNNVYPVAVSSLKLEEFIKTWTSGKYAQEKELNLDCLLQSISFRKGILDGYYLTDGGNSNRIYTTSSKLVEEIEVLISSLGKHSIIDVTDRTNEPVIIRGETYKRNYPVYCIRWYEPMNKRSMGEVFKVKNNSVYFKISSIEKIDYLDDVFCFEMANSDEPYFTLPNGIITHNCRLINDIELFELGGQSNSFGGSAISLGSHRVVTLPFNRMALEATSYENYYEILQSRIIDASNILISHRHLIKSLTEKGLHPFISNGWLDLNKMFSTFGILGSYEAQKTLESKFGITEDSTEKSLKLLNFEAKRLSIEKHNVFNIEEIPAESQAVKACKSDQLLFGIDKVPYVLYSNQFVPLWEDATVIERMEIDGKYNSLLTGGGISHINTGEKTTYSQNKWLITKSIESGCEHFAITIVYSECENNHNSLGDFDICPVCKEKIVEKYQRVVGFFTPVSSWNKERREWEFPRRTKAKF